MYSFKKEQDETDDMLYDKSWFIIKKLGDCDAETAQCLAKMWINKKYFGVMYPAEIEKVLDQYK